MPEDFDRVLAVVAHPDDLEYGAASAIARWTAAGKHVVYVLVTRGEAGISGIDPVRAAAIREEEQRASAAVCGVDAVEFLDHRDGVIEYGIPLRRDVARVVRRHRPDVVVTLNHHTMWGQGAFNTPDHRNVGLAVIDGTRDASNEWVFTELLDDGLEPWSGARAVLVSGSPQPTHAVDVTATLERGIASLHEHRTYLEHLAGWGDPAEFLRATAEAAGARAGCPLAVTFERIAL
jgi:LmbE family N-acetylglucosaminyl deacetylase